MASGEQIDFSNLAKPIPPPSKQRRDVVATVAPKAEPQPKVSGGPDFSRIATPLTENSANEGVYEMTGPDGKDIKIPFSRVLSAGKAGYKLKAKEYPVFTQDFHYKYNKAASQKPEDSPESVFGNEPTSEWLKRKAYSAARTVTDLLPTAGSIIGGAATGIPGVATGPADLAIAAAGAAAGGALGEVVRQGIDDYIWGETMTPGERATNIGEQAALGGISEFGGRYAGRFLTKGAQYFGDTAKKAALAGFKLLPHEAQGTAANFAERYAKASLFSSGRMARFREAQNKETLAAAEKLATDISNYSGTQHDFGKMVQDGIGKYEEGFRNQQTRLYSQIDQKAANAGVMPDRTALRNFAEEQIKNMDLAKKAGGVSPVSKLRPMLEEIIASKDPTSTYQAMKEARSGWLALSRSWTEPLSGPEKGLVDQIVKLTDNSMTDAARNSGVPGLVNEVRHANDLTRTTHDLFESQLIKNIVKEKSPSKIARMVTLPGTSPEMTEALMKVLTSPSDRAAVQAHLLRNAVAASTKTGQVAFNERLFSKTILKIGDDKGMVIFGSNWPRISEIAKIMANITGETGGRGGAAELSNPALVKDAIFAAIGIGTASPGVFVGGAAAQWTTINAFVSALQHPDKAARVLTALQKVARALPYGGMMAENAMTGSAERDERQRLAKRNKILPAPAPAPEPAKPSPTQTRTATTAQPTNPPNKKYARYATGPNGHKVGSDDNGVTLFDVLTGQRVK
jgi:hypothetical protein